MEKIDCTVCLGRRGKTGEGGAKPLEGIEEAKWLGVGDQKQTLGYHSLMISTSWSASRDVLCEVFLEEG